MDQIWNVFDFFIQQPTPATTPCIDDKSPEIQAAWLFSRTLRYNTVCIDFNRPRAAASNIRQLCWLRWWPVNLYTPCYTSACVPRAKQSTFQVIYRQSMNTDLSIKLRYVRVVIGNACVVVLEVEYKFDDQTGQFELRPFNVDVQLENGENVNGFAKVDQIWSRKGNCGRTIACLNQET